MIDPEILREKVIATFPTGGVPIHSVKNDVHESTHSGVDFTRRSFEGVQWTDVDLTQNHAQLADALVFLTNDAYTYYFPAFLTLLSDSQAYPHSLLIESFLQKVNARNADDWTLNFYLELGTERSEIVAMCLEFCWWRHHDGLVLLALEDYWDSFLSQEQKQAIYQSPEALQINQKYLEITTSNRRRV